MPQALIISTAKPKEKALDYESLRSMAIRHIENTASKIWTDYNIHDPGITSMELLCYAITDLAYRCSYPVPDLLADEKNNAATVISHYKTAKEILPNKAVTIHDYRKLLVDIEGIKNAWLRKKIKTVYADLVENKLVRDKPAARRHEEVTVKGYYEALLEFDINVKTDEDKKKRLAEANEVLLKNRNLCEDFIEIKEVSRQPFRLCGELEIKSGADPVETLVKVFLNIQLFLNPLIIFYTLKEMLDANIPSGKIFQGPTLQKGFIKDEDLLSSELKTEIHLSDIMQQILKAEEVVNINDIIFNPSNQAEQLPNKWVIDVKDGFQPVLDVLTSNVLLYKDGMPFRPDMNKIKIKYEEELTKIISANETKSSENISFNTGKFRNPAAYLPLRFHFPKTYGIGQWGLPDDAPALRKTQAKQLKAYLWHFDQLLANYLSQLANVRNLFSIDETLTQTYFTQPADEFEKAKDLFADEANVKSHLQDAAEDTALFSKRRNLFLDHLLSRFAESFFDYVSILKTIFPSTTDEEIRKTKTDFLNNYPEYSSERFCACRYNDAFGLWDTDNISGLEKRLERLLGFKDMKRRNLVILFSSITEEDDGSGNSKFRFALSNKKTGKTMLRSAELFETKENCTAELEVAFTLAINAANYKITEDAGKFHYELRDKVDKLIAASAESFNSKNAANNALKKFIELFAAQSEEGMFLIEHLLLFPDSANQFLPVCADPDCEDCADTDPYSFRISIVLPAYAPRFLNMDFRRYCERVIRFETPAHLFPKICWVNNEQLNELEEAYREWLGVKAGIRTDPDGKILKRLITILTSLKSIYPPSTLQDCSSSEERKLFLLNQHSLGTLKT